MSLKLPMVKIEGREVSVFACRLAVAGLLTAFNLRPAMSWEGSFSASLVVRAAEDLCNRGVPVMEVDRVLHAAKMTPCQRTRETTAAMLLVMRHFQDVLAETDTEH